MTDVIADVIFYAFVVWTYSYIVWLMRGKSRESTLYRFLQETKQGFKLVIVLKMTFTNTVYYIFDGGGWMFLYPFVTLIDLLWFFFIRDIDDDDRWKKRKKKAAEKVKEVAGRLVVVPELAPVTGK